MWFADGDHPTIDRVNQTVRYLFRAKNGQPFERLLFVLRMEVRMQSSNPVLKKQSYLRMSKTPNHHLHASLFHRYVGANGVEIIPNGSELFFCVSVQHIGEC